jgi:hypothetical protein
MTQYRSVKNIYLLEQAGEAWHQITGVLDRDQLVFP